MQLNLAGPKILGGSMVLVLYPDLSAECVAFTVSLAMRVKALPIFHAGLGTLVV